MKRIGCLLVMLCVLLCFTACEGTPAVTTFGGTADELTAILDDIATLPVGTAGVSMTATQKAASLLQWGEATAFTADEIEVSVTAYYAALDVGGQAYFVEQLSYIGGVCNLLKAENTRAEQLAQVELNAADYAWGDKAFANAAVVCGALKDVQQAVGTEPFFKGTVLEVYATSVLVEPLEGEEELQSSDRITVNTMLMSGEVNVGDILCVEYDGMIAESYPAQIQTVYAVWVES